MHSDKKVKDEFVFREDREGKLQFVGDFDALYASDIDSWGQSADGDLNYKKYYDFSRARLAGVIKSIENKKLYSKLVVERALLYTFCRIICLDYH